MTNTASQNTLEIRPPSSPAPVCLGSIRLSRFGSIIVIPEDACPLLTRFLVVLRIQGGIDITVVDLHLGPRATIVGIHGLGDTSPVLRSGDRLALRAGRVPGVGLVGG